MPLLDAMQSYLAAERSFGLYFAVPTGAILLALAAWTWTQETGSFRLGLALPLVLFGLVLVGVGAGLALRTPGQVAALQAAYAQSPAALLAIELPRMARVNANWPVLLATWCGLLGLGLALRFGVRRAWAEGLGTALVLVGALGVLIDTVSARRARPYTAVLESAGAAEPARE